MPVRVASRVAAGGNSRSVPRRTRAAWAAGVRLPGSRASSASRGEKPRPTGRARGIGAGEGQVAPAGGLEMAGLGAARHEGLPTGRTNGAFGAGQGREIREGTGEGEVLEHLGAQARQTGVQRGFD